MTGGSLLAVSSQFSVEIGGTRMKLTTLASICVGVSAMGIAANFLLWRYRLHLYNLNTDYDREPLQSVQMVLLWATIAIIAGGALVLLVEAVRKKARQIHKPQL